MMDLVSPLQSSFTPGRGTHDNILVLQEVIHSTRSSKSKTGNMLIKLDLEKAYDKINWDFLEQTLFQDFRICSEVGTMFTGHQLPNKRLEAMRKRNKLPFCSRGFLFRWGQHRREYPEAFLRKADARGKGDYQIDFTPSPRITEADKSNDKRSLQRALDQMLYLLLYSAAYGSDSKPVWHFPGKVYESEQTLRKRFFFKSQVITTNKFNIESQYLTELLVERQKLGPFTEILPICSQLLDQEILRISGRIQNEGFSDYGKLPRGSPSPGCSLDVMLDIGGKCISNWNCNVWSGIQQERLGGPQCMTMDWQSAPGSPSSFLVKRVLRLDIPVERYPNFNFIGRLLGPRGNSLKRVEASSGCRVFIRGRGSIKDPNKEESLRGRAGYEHLKEPLHVLIEAELPAHVVDLRLKQTKEIIEELLKPVDESQDMYKRQQLRELAMLNNVREEKFQARGSMSPFNSGGTKRPKTSW
ncbi:hypothetical protein BUALT_Bualt13G0104600 [Buddleja alternifolia]|uniref:K Homology domain-containing protein n=1 Tax=Buddleja alternifolia TaxID=168488 RepID=A0AAV6WN33_9LAMI|nr:hypothetical protein BUALT_Bualt13G0104600 [Buddleja alternifolia]